MRHAFSISLVTLIVVAAVPAAAGDWTRTGDMITPREQHTATVLEDGRVLVVAGVTGNQRDVTASTEIYDPALGTFMPAESLAEARCEHAATLLDDGRVLVAGGSYADNQYSLDAVEIYDPLLDTWTTVAPMLEARAGHAALLLADGRVLVMGGDAGFEGGYEKLASAEVYDPAADTWTAVSPMGEPREHFSATALSDGRVVVLGGAQDNVMAIALAEVFDPVTNVFEAAGSMALERVYHTVVRLPDDRLFTVGGKAATDGATTAEIYDPATQSSELLPEMGVAHSYSHAFGLFDGRVLVAASISEVFDPSRAPPWDFAGSMEDARYFAAAVMLLDGYVLVTGGRAESSAPSRDPLASAEIWDAAGQSQEPLAFPCNASAQCASGFCADGICCKEACDKGSCDTCLSNDGAGLAGTCTATISCGMYVLDEVSCSTSEPACKTSCLTDADCGWSGYVCEVESQACVADMPGGPQGSTAAGQSSPLDDEQGEGCDCSVVATESSAARFSAVGLLVAALGLRARRRRR